MEPTIGRVPSFVATLGTMTVTRGIVLIITQGVPIQITDERFLTVYSGKSFFGMPNTAFFMIAAIIVAFIFLEKTPFGKEIRAVGGVGSIFGTILGAFVIQILSNGMNMMGLSPYLQSIVKGSILVLAVFVSIDRKKKTQTK